MRILLFASFCLVIGACAQKDQHGTHHSDRHALKHAIKGDHRTPKNKDRDVYRHPMKTLKFFGIKPSMAVVEISPGGGWYSEILADYLKQGQLYLAIFGETSKKSYRPRLNKQLKAKMAEMKKTDHIQYTTFEVPTQMGPIAPAGSADAVLTFRNLHNWMNDKVLDKALKEFHKALKPGGTLGIVEHRTRHSKKQDPRAQSGYVREDYVIQAVEAAGFEFVAKSEINANALDTADHPKGVWTLPPFLFLKDKDRAKYLAIGESDRMTLKFRKK